MADEPKPEPRSAEEVRRDLESARAQVASSALALRQKVARAATWLERTPVLLAVGAVLGALAVGYLLGRPARPRRPRRF